MFVKSVIAIFCFLVPIITSSSIQPGYYYTNITSSISNGTSSRFLVTAGSGLTVTVAGTNPGNIYSNSKVNITWNYHNNTGTANITLVSLTNPSITYPTISVPDTGNAIVNLTQFSAALHPGIYYIKVVNVFGTGNSNQFPVASRTGLIVSLSPPSAPSDTPVILDISWVPYSTVGLANISIRSFTLGNATILATNLPDTGSHTVTINEPIGSYFIIVNSSIGNGSAIFDYTGDVNVTATPNNISAANTLGTSNTISNITWLPVSSQTTVPLTISNSSGTIITLTVNNTGTYQLNATALGLSPSQYTITIDSFIGSGSTILTVYRETGLIIISPTNTTIAYNNNVAFNVSWIPFYNDGPLTNITFQDLNTGLTYNFSTNDNGTAVLNLTAQNLSASSYNITVSSALGSGLYNNFTLRYPQYLTIFTPNSTTVVKNNGTLLTTWTPTDLAGGESIFYIYNAYNSSLVYGPFFRIDNGTTTFNLAIPAKALPAGVDNAMQNSDPESLGAIKHKLVRV